MENLHYLKSLLYTINNMDLLISLYTSGDLKAPTKKIRKYFLKTIHFQIEISENS